MANHAEVKTKKQMTPEGITALLNEMNATIFRNVLKIEYCDCRNETGAWGDHVWIINVHPKDPSPNINYGTRECWLNNPKSFEIRHGGGSSFLWWIDFAITNEVALRYNGVVIDESDGIREKPVQGKYDSFGEYIRRMNFILTYDYEITPREFYDGLDKAKKVKD